jgi:hypothetical protein
MLAGNSLMSAFGSRTTVVPRSQSVNAAFELVGWQQEINLYDQDLYWSLSLAPVYTRTMRNYQLLDYLFNGCNTFVFSGSRVNLRGANDILADYFGLPADFKSTVIFEPRITNFIFDIDWYLGLDRVYEGLFLRIHAPIVHTKWDLNMDECIANPGTDFHPAGYMGPLSIAPSFLAHSVGQAMQGTRVVDGEVQPLVYGDVREPLKYGRIFGRQERSGLSDVQIAFGWNFLSECWYHVGLAVRTALPTGNKTCAELLFEPMIGNGHHWELGLGLTSHVDVWRDAQTGSAIALYFDMNVTHLFTSTQRRSFEFATNGAGNRYMLLEELVNGSTDLFFGFGGPAAPNQYNQRLVPAINLTSFCAKISVPVQVDAVVKCAFITECGLEFDIGYNLWARSAEKLHCRGQLKGMFAFKGDAQVYGFTTTNAPSALNATESQATLHGGPGAGNFVSPDQFGNADIDSPTPAASSGGILFQLDAADSSALGIGQVQVNTSNPALFVSDKNINDSSGISPSALTHKLFAYINKRWEREEGVVPFLGCGAMAEFAQCGSKNKCGGVSQWGLIFKGGLSY